MLPIPTRIARPVPLALLVLVCISAAAQSPVPNPLAAARVFAFDAMVARTTPNGAVSRNVFRGALATGETVAVHETMQPAGTVPNPVHRIQHSELIVVQEGTLEFQHDGKTERANAGSIIYVTPGTLHTVQNIGGGPAKYVVVAIGGDAGK
jgi:quercetin dioxygenase-like cupin family protein